MIVFHNPQKIWFKIPLDCYYASVKAPFKYDWILDYLEERGEVAFFVEDGKANGPFRGMLRFLNTNSLELLLWMYLNKIPFRKKMRIRNIEELRLDDIFFTFSYGNYHYSSDKVELSAEQSIEELARCKARKIVHLSHFGYNAPIASNNLEKIKPDVLISETNLPNGSAYYRRHFDWFKSEFASLPFKPHPRFRNIKPFSKRFSKAVATGTIAYVDDDAYLKFFGGNILQPLRHEIFQKKHEISEHIDCRISLIDVATTARKTLIKRLFDFVYSSAADIVFLIRVLLRLSNKLDNDRSYYKSDMNNVYNNYQLVLCPEEAIGLPAIGAFEAMACGCAYIGFKSDIYSSIGMIDGVHYIGHDGTVEDIIEKIKYYQSNFIELEKISFEGEKFIKSFNYEGRLSEIFAVQEQQY
jgi:hypothetical protein